MTEFKVRDRVRAYGRVGTIVGAYNIGWDVLMDDAPRKPIQYKGWYYTENDLELVEETDPRDRALDEIRDIVKCAFGRRYDAIQAVEVQIPNILRETGRL